MIYAEGKKKPSDAPMTHYKAIYSGLDPMTTSMRTGLDFDGSRSTFSFRCMGRDYMAGYPDFKLLDGNGEEVKEPWLALLMIRYLCEGKYAPSARGMIAYRDIPWGDVYQHNFDGRVTGRFLRQFGSDIPMFRKVMEEEPDLKSVALDGCDAGYRFEFLNGLYISLKIWEGDEEFPPSAQILFADNFKYAFTAEDVAVVCDIFIAELGRRKRGAIE